MTERLNFAGGALRVTEGGVEVRALALAGPYAADRLGEVPLSQGSADIVNLPAYVAAAMEAAEGYSPSSATVSFMNTLDGKDDNVGYSLLAQIHLGN